MSRIAGVARKIYSALCKALYVLCIAVCALMAFVSVSARKSADGTVTVLGWQIRLVLSTSMDSCEDTDVSQYSVKSLPLYSAAVVQLAPESEKMSKEWYSSLKVGDVLTVNYVYGTAVTLSHRIISIDPSDSGGYIIRLRGDNTGDSTGLLVQTIDTGDYESENRAIGKVFFCSAALGRLLGGMKKPLVITLTALIPGALICIVQIVRIIFIVAGGREQKNKEVKL